MHKIEKLDKLLKNEFSAMETYQQALDKLRENAVRVSVYLVPIYDNHKDAFSSLQAKSGNWEKLLRRPREPWEVR